jgi:hypothetical protein
MTDKFLKEVYEKYKKYEEIFNNPEAKNHKAWNMMRELWEAIKNTLEDDQNPTNS